MELCDIKGLKEKRIAELQKAGIHTPMDLLSFFPKKYVDLNNFTDFNNVTSGEDVLFSVIFNEKPRMSFFRKNMCIARAGFEVEGKKIECVWYNQRFVASAIAVGERYYIIGKAEINGKNVKIVNPKAVRCDKCQSRMLVFYRPLKNIGSSVLSSAIKTVLSSVEIVSFIPDELRKKYGLINLSDAYRAIHFPTEPSQIGIAKQSVSIEYLNYTLCVYSLIRHSSQRGKARKYISGVSALEKVCKRLPFELTCDQRLAVNDIISDMNSETCMNRLLQGDVGSGKTIIAFLGMYYVFMSGYQSVLMCPTELLAKQHYQTLCKLFPEVAGKSCLLYSSLNAAEKKRTVKGIADGEFSFIIGTHSVFGNDVVFKSLAFVVTDEQHRFGVNQRSSLENKTADADCLVMSATPIPRTLALTLYGDLKQSAIRYVPENKAEIVTRIVSAKKIDAMWKYFCDCAARDARTYVVCPRIEDEDDGITSCKDLYAQKKKLGSFIGLLHGQMTEKDKTSVMNAFVSGEIKILISTTVIEVGIDVRQAVNIAVYNPERFGLSQLHQLRGRVGRGTEKSYCFLVAENAPESAVDRLKHLERCSDGFELAEYDFNSRGAGDFLGSSQHGKSDMIVSAENIRIAKDISDSVLSDSNLCRDISATIDDNRYDYYKNITLN